MSRIEGLCDRYHAVTSLAKNGAEIVVISDPAGARFNAALRRLTTLVKQEGGSFLDDLMGPSRALRWRRITQPQPILLNPSLEHLVGEVAKQATRFRGALEDEALLDELTTSAAELSAADPPVGIELIRSIREVGAESCLVIAASMPAVAGLSVWLRDHGVQVVSAGEGEREKFKKEQAYVVGPPRFFRSSTVTAPISEEVSFLLPSWFGDRSIPRSAIAAYAEGAIQVPARVFSVGDVSETVSEVPDEIEDLEDYLPQPSWGSRGDSSRTPTSEEVEARKLLLSGHLAMWLDDGDRIRSLDPHQPTGERVTFTDVSNVRKGTYLLLRQGETEREALYQAAIAKLTNSESVENSQKAWKQALTAKLQELGFREVARQLNSVGIKRSERARAWTDHNLIRPESDQDFERLLQWLDIAVEPTFGNATTLHKSLYRASAEIRRRLEVAIAGADLTELRLSGFLSLELEAEGFRGMIATRVLAVSPFIDVVPRRDVRVPIEDWSGQWLE